jgi:hypothetical protein
MTTKPTISIGSAPSDYPTFAAWKAAQTSLNLTVSDIQPTLVFKAEKHAPIDISGFTTDATRYITVMGADANVLSNKPLRYDNTLGTVFETTAAYVSPISCTVGYTRIIGVQMGSLSSSMSALPAMYFNTGADGSLVDRCLMTGPCQDSADGLSFVLRGYGLVTISNSLVVSRATDPTAYIASLVYGAKAINTGFVSLLTKLNIGIKTTGTAAQMTNCYVMNVTAPEDGITAAIKTACYSNATATGYTTVPYSTATFTSIATDGTHDFSLPTGSALVGVTTTAAGGATSINNVTLAAGAARDAGPWQTTASTAPNTNPPNLSSPSGTATGATTASLSVSTDKAGTIYYLVNTSATATVAAVKAGTAITASNTGTYTPSVTGLAGATTYYAHFVETDSSAQDSTVVNSNAFTTAAVDSVAPAWPGGAVITPGTITSSSLAFSYPTATDNVGVAKYQTSKDNGATWQDNGTGTTGQFTGLAASTTYPIAVRALDAAGNASTSITLSMTTAAAAVNTASFKTLPLANNTGTPWAVGTAVTWEWRQARIGDQGTSTYGSGTIASDKTLTATGLPAGAGALLAAVRGANWSADSVYVQPGTAA